MKEISKEYYYNSKKIASQFPKSGALLKLKSTFSKKIKKLYPNNFEIDRIIIDCDELETRFSIQGFDSNSFLVDKAYITIIGENTNVNSLNRLGSANIVKYFLCKYSEISIIIDKIKKECSTVLDIMEKYKKFEINGDQLNNLIFKKESFTQSELYKLFIKYKTFEFVAGEESMILYFCSKFSFINLGMKIEKREDGWFIIHLNIAKSLYLNHLAQSFYDLKKIYKIDGLDEVSDFIKKFNI